MILGGRRLTLLVVATGLPLALGGALPQPALAAGTAWTTDHFDAARSGNDLNDPELSGPVNPAWTSPVLDGRVYGEPLYLNGVLYATTQNNSLYALNASNGNILWSNLAMKLTVPLSEVHTETGIGGGCGNIDPMGIIGTPVIDPSLGTAGTLFAVAETYSGIANSNTIEHRLLAVDLNTHAVTERNIDGSYATTGATRGLHQERGALNISSGRVVVPYGGMTGDCGDYHGAVVSSLENLTGPANAFEAEAMPGHSKAGIWAAVGTAVDGAGNVYAATGNGSPPGDPYDFSDAVVKLPSTMGQILGTDTAHYFAPSAWQSDNAADLDLGSNTPTLIPRSGSALIFQTGKQHTGFLLDSANLGGIGGQLFSALACDGEARGGNAYANGILYVPCTEGLRALDVNTATPSFSRRWQGPGDANGPPIIAGGRVWVHDNGRVLGLNTLTGATEVMLNGVATPYNFASPSAGGGKLYFASSTPGGPVIAAFSGGGTSQLVGAVGNDDALWTNQDHNGWNSRTGVLLGAPAVVSVPNGPNNGAPLFIGTGGDHDLWVRTTTLGWQRLDDAPAYCIDNPAAAVISGTLYIACRGGDNGLWLNSHAVSPNVIPLFTRSSFQALGGNLSAGPALARVPNRAGPDIMAVNSDHTVSDWYGGSFHQAPFGCIGHPALASNAAGTNAYFACKGLDNALWWSQNDGSTNGGNWFGTASLNGYLLDGPAVATNNQGPTFFGEGGDRAVWERTLGNGWTSDGGIVKYGVGAAGLF